MHKHEKINHGKKNVHLPECGLLMKLCKKYPFSYKTPENPDQLPFLIKIIHHITLSCNI